MFVILDCFILLASCQEIAILAGSREMPRIPCFSNHTVKPQSYSEVLVFVSPGAGSVASASVHQVPQHHM